MGFNVAYPEDTRLESPEVVDDKKQPQIQDDLDDRILHLVLAEKLKYELNSNEIREIIRKCYRNFMGIFDSPFTKYTNRKQEFWALTQYHTLASASQIYVDPRAINILPQEEGDITKAKIWNYLIPFQLKQINFFQAMNGLSIDLALFGTVVSSQEWDFQRETVYEEKGADKYDADLNNKENPDKGSKVTKTKVKVDKLGYKFIPLLNVFTDATANSLQEAPSVIVSSWVEATQLPELKKKFNWKYSVDGIQ
ncbi:MAG TPA: hypothetical protein VM577_07530, partial [Anaerovoracaceae bacterium]|nr:hypothetical protein [Anaerovoracaceae bacterium]